LPLKTEPVSEEENLLLFFRLVKSSGLWQFILLYTFIFLGEKSHSQITYGSKEFEQRQYYLNN